MPGGGEAPHRRRSRSASLAGRPSGARRARQAPPTARHPSPEPLAPGQRSCAQSDRCRCRSLWRGGPRPTSMASRYVSIIGTIDGSTARAFEARGNGCDELGASRRDILERIEPSDTPLVKVPRVGKQSQRRRGPLPTVMQGYPFSSLSSLALHGHRFALARGYGGQLIAVVPRLDTLSPSRHHLRPDPTSAPQPKATSATSCASSPTASSPRPKPHQAPCRQRQPAGRPFARRIPRPYASGRLAMTGEKPNCALKARLKAASEL